jgi:hypothetical protein
MLLDASAGESIKSKTPTEVEQLIETMCRNEYNKEEDKDNKEVFIGQLEASQTEVEKLQEENKSLKEFMQSFGDQIKKSNEKLGIQVQAWAKKVEDIGELEPVGNWNNITKQATGTSRTYSKGKKDGKPGNTRISNA